LSSLFCRHNRFTADCPICSKGTVLDPSRRGERARPARAPTVKVKRPGRTSTAAAGEARVVTGPYVSAGPYEDGAEVRFEKVPGGVRLALWQNRALEKRAPVLAAVDLRLLVGEARERSLLPAPDIESLERALSTDPAEGEAADFGASPGRAGDMREELRVEPVGDGSVRVGRWLLWPGSGWELQESPVMVPPKRLAEAFRAAARGGVLARAAMGGGAGSPQPTADSPQI
jgi:hypothetical protein